MSNEDIIKEIKQKQLDDEKRLSPYATSQSRAIRINDLEEDIRSPFARDADRIINSLAYNRYIDKAQVYTHDLNDHTSRRIEHVMRVNKIARTIGQALNLNLDLIEAISLGHDIGHTPLGHVGEAIINKISLAYNEEYFHHNIQSVRYFMTIENGGLGANLTLQTLDGIMCHNGELELLEYYPKRKSYSNVIEEYYKSYNNKDIINNLVPMTLEGCVVRVSDIIGYLGYDIEDAISLGKLKRDDLPADIVSILGNDNRSIVNNLIMDVILNSYNKPYIKMSEEVFDALKKLKRFNYENIYQKAHTNDMLDKYDNMFNELFNFYLHKIENKDESSDIYINFLNNMNKEYNDNTSQSRKVIDYLAGMTDGYIKKQYTRSIKKD